MNHQVLLAELSDLRKSNAWFRARNLELLRQLTGQRNHPGDPDPVHVHGDSTPNSKSQTPNSEAPHCCGVPMTRDGDVWQCWEEACRNFVPFIRDSRANLAACPATQNPEPKTQNQSPAARRDCHALPIAQPHQ